MAHNGADIVFLILLLIPALSSGTIALRGNFPPGKPSPVTIALIRGNYPLAWGNCLPGQSLYTNTISLFCQKLEHGSHVPQYGEWTLP